MPSRRSPRAGTFIVLTGASLFATLGPLSRFAYEGGMDPLSFVAWRTGLAALALAIVVWWRVWVVRNSPRPAFPGRRAAGSLALATMAGLLLNVAVFSAFERTTVALALLGFYTYPAMVAATAMLLGRERATSPTLAALGVAVVGMVLVLVGGLDPAGVRFDALGLGLAVGAAACQTVFVTISRDGYRAVPADQAMATILAGTSAMCFVVAVAVGADLGSPLRDPGLLSLMLAAGVLGAAVPSLLFLIGIRLVGGTHAGILMLFEPVVGVALAAILLGESLGPIQGLGGLAILAAAVILQRVPVAHAAPRPARPLDVGAPAGPDGSHAADEQAEAEEEALVSHVPGGP